MSVLIKSMINLPEHCYECPCHDGESGYCQADKEHRYSDYRPFWCPLVEVNNDILYNNCKEIADGLEVLDKIREEFISLYPKNYAGMPELGGASCVFSLYKVLSIIDKYKSESDGG